MRKIAVTTPVGQIGQHVVAQLMARGESVVAIGLEGHRDRLRPLIEKGLEFHIASQDDEGAMIEATKGASALFWLTPPNVLSDMKAWFRKTAQTGARAIAANKIEHVVNLSSIGAGMKEGLGTVSYIGLTEKILNEAATNIVHLRPGYFMENLLLQKESIAKGSFAFTFPADHDLPWISTRDIGAAAARYLADPDWKGQWYVPLMGPENLTPLDLAKRLSRVLNHQVEYKRLTPDELRLSMMNAGLSAEAAQDLVLTMQALGDPDGVYAHPRTHEAATPTTIEEFVRRAGFVSERI